MFYAVSNELAEPSQSSFSCIDMMTVSKYCLVFGEHSCASPEYKFIQRTNGESNIAMNTRTPHRDALRILFSIRAGAEPVKDDALPEVIAIFRGEMRLLAFDFWIRNPDYLAIELLDLFETTGDFSYYAAAESIFDAEEPDIRRVPMIRYFFGAFDRIDDALSLLRSRDLIRITGVKSKGKVQQTDFLLTMRGTQFCEECVKVAPILTWYADRAELVARVAGDRGGTALKEQQYQRASYAETTLGGVIPPIAFEVQQRLEKLRGAMV